MSDNEYEEKGDSGALRLSNVQTGHLKRGSHVIIKGRPCKVDSISTSKPGKHGSAKCHIIAIDIFTNKKVEEISPSQGSMQSPEVKRVEYPLHDIDGDFLILWDESESCQIEHIRLLEDEIGKKIKEMHDGGLDILVTVLTAMGEEKVIDVKEDTKKD